MGRNATRSHFDLLSIIIYLFVINSCVYRHRLLRSAVCWGAARRSTWSKESSASEIIAHDMICERNFEIAIRVYRAKWKFSPFFLRPFDVRFSLATHCMHRISGYTHTLHTHLFNGNRFTFHEISPQSRPCRLFALAALFRVIRNGNGCDAISSPLKREHAMCISIV